MDTPSCIGLFQFHQIVMSSPHFLSWDDLVRANVLTTEENCLQYCIDVGILRDQRYCDSCQQWMTLVKCSTQKYKDGCCWRCPGGAHSQSIRTDSLLAKKQISAAKFLHLLWLYCTFSSVCQAAVTLSMDAKKVRGFFKAIRQCMASDLLSGDAMIGGPGQIVEIDESKFGKRKYHCGRRVVGKWVLGGVTRGSGECFLVECPNNKRDANTLCLLILQFVRPGTTIITDKWKGYLPLQHHGYTHYDVNHSRNFVDPVTGAHTNTIEGTWFHTKRHVKRGHGRVRRDSKALSIALYEFMWMKRYGLTRSDSDCRRLFNKDLPMLFKRLFG